MPPMNMVIAQSNLLSAQRLSEALRPRARSLVTADCAERMRDAILRNRAEVVIVDLETVSLDAVRQLRRDFPQVCVICTHRVADEAMWVAAVDAGADDCCLESDLHGILLAASRGSVITAAHAA